jgi:hypothetical protein
MKHGAAAIPSKSLLAVLVVGFLLSSCFAESQDLCGSSKLKAGDRVTVAGVFATDGHQNSVFEADRCPQKRFGLLLDEGDETVSGFDDAVLAEAIKSGGADRHYRLTLDGRYLEGHGKPDGVIEVLHISRWEPARVEHPR